MGPSLRKLLLIALGVIVLGTLTAFWAPYGTGRLGWPLIWYYWTGIMALGWGCGLAVEALLRIGMPRLSMPLPYAAASVAAALIAITATIVFHLSRGEVLNTASYLNVTLQVGVLTGVMTLVYAVIKERGRPSAAEVDEAVAAPVAGAALLERLEPRHQRASLFAISAEDHYLRVHTSVGDTLIRMRMSDALLAVAELEGAQTHRSWWVARDAVKAVKRANGKAELTLTGDIKAPVSRSFAPALREAGWF